MSAICEKELTTRPVPVDRLWDHLQVVGQHRQSTVDTNQLLHISALDAATCDSARTNAAYVDLGSVRQNVGQLDLYRAHTNAPNDLPISYVIKKLRQEANDEVTRPLFEPSEIAEWFSEEAMLEEAVQFDRPILIDMKRKRLLTLLDPDAEIIGDLE